MPKVSDEHRQARRRQILEAAMHSFIEHGFQESSMNDIITESGLSAGAIYGHFSGKSEIIAAVATEVLGGGLADIGDARMPDGAPMHPIEFVQRLVAGITQRTGGTALPVQIWGRASVDPGLRTLFRQVIPEIVATVHDQIDLWMREARGLSVADAAKRSSALAPLVTGMMQGAVVQAELLEEFDLAEYLEPARPLFDA